jgi:23S rRNA (uracil1939-C5)-methyltransferase
VAVGEAVTIFVLRNLEPVPEGDAAKLRAFADEHGIQWWLQPKGPDTAYPFHPLEAPALDYHLPEFGLEIGFRPTEFTQVNAGVNRILVKRAVDMLDPRPGERVGDLFCGLGNFSLALATRGADVIGIEGSHFLWKMVRRIVGVLVEIGRGGLPPDAAATLLTDTSAAPARLTAPPSGLFLDRVYYQNEPRDAALRAATPLG